MHVLLAILVSLLFTPAHPQSHSMIDRAKIILPYLPIHPEAVTDTKAFGEAVGLPHLTGGGPKYGGPTKGYSAVLSALPNDAVRITATKTEDGQWLSRSVEVNLSALLHGHNAIPITTAPMLCAALSELQTVVSKFLICRADHVRVIPGLRANAGSYWSKVELPLNLHDPEGHLSHLLQGCTHNAIRNDPMTRKGSRKLPGTELTVNVYSTNAPDGGGKEGREFRNGQSPFRTFTEPGHPGQLQPLSKDHAYNPRAGGRESPFTFRGMPPDDEKSPSIACNSRKHTAELFPGSAYERSPQDLWQQWGSP